MAINYSKVQMACPPGSKTKKVYARAQYASIMSIQEFSKHISDHNSVYDRSTIQGVLAKAVDCLREELLLGRKVQLGDLGAFYVVVHSKGTDTAEEFSSSNITGISVKLSVGENFKTLMKDATFEFVPTRAMQAEARKATNESIDSDSSGGSSSSSGSGSGSGGGSVGEAN